MKGVLGTCLTEIGRYGDAEPLVLESYVTISGSRGAEDERTKRALNRVIALYEAWGKPDKAAEYRALLPRPSEAGPNG